MSPLNPFRMLARYNRIANDRLYARCSELNDDEYRKERRGSFGSIHALLNHILLGDRIWMSRFRGGGATTPALGSILYPTLPELRAAREREDEEIVAFFAAAKDDFLGRMLSYRNSAGKAYEESAMVAVIHFFNHQTHHRGQVHVMLSQTDVAPPSLDLHRILNP